VPRTVAVASGALGALGLSLLAALGGCARDGNAEQPAPTPSAPSSRPADPRLQSGPTGSDGLNVRYLDADGSIKTLQVRDFVR
jgi:hypothetical protein